MLGRQRRVGLLFFVAGGLIGPGAGWCHVGEDGGDELPELQGLLGCEGVKDRVADRLDVAWRGLGELLVALVIEKRPNVTTLLRIAAVLRVIWGLVHMFAGIVTIGRDTTEAVQGIADGVEPAALEADYPDAAGAIINQHGFNLLWIGAVTLICAWFIWRRSLNAVLLAALVGGLADIGYFLFLDLGGHVIFVPGTVMTIFSATAIITSFTAAYIGRGTPIQAARGVNA